MIHELYTQEQSTLDAMVTVSGIGYGSEARDIFLMTHKIAAVMREHCNWTLNDLQADDVAKEVCYRFNI